MQCERIGRATIESGIVKSKVEDGLEEDHGGRLRLRGGGGTIVVAAYDPAGNIAGETPY